MQQDNGPRVSSRLWGIGGALLAISLSVASAQSGIRYIYDALGRLRAAVDPAGQTAVYRYDDVGNILSASVQASDQLAVIEFSPIEGLPGTEVSIFGTAFSLVSSENSVQFNGVEAQILFSSFVKLVAVVPAGATSGLITVTKSGESASSETSFGVLASGAPPQVVNIVPTAAGIGSTVAIAGANFDPVPANNKTRFNVTLAPSGAANATLIETTVPTGSGSGRITISTPTGTAVSSDDFFVPPPSYTGVDALGFRGRVQIGLGSSLTIQESDEIGVLLFDAVAGQRIGIDLSGVTIPLSRVSLVRPDGTAQAFWTVTANTTINFVDLPQTGTFAIVVDPDRYILTEAGTGVAGYNGEGTATGAQLNYPRGVALDNSGDLYIADTDNNRIRLVKGNGRISTVVGNGTPGYSGDGGKPGNAQLNHPWDVALDAAGNLYVADTSNSRVRKVTPGQKGKISTLAQISAPRGLAIGPSGELFVSTGNLVQKVDSVGNVTTVAGTGSPGFDGDGGPALDAKLHSPQGLAFDSLGNLYIADSSNHRIRMVDSTGMIHTVAGGGAWGDGGDGGPAIDAQMKVPAGVAIDTQGNLFFSEFDGQRVRKVGVSGTITTVAGDGTPGYAGSGVPAGLGKLLFPHDLAADVNGDVYIADMTNQRVRRIGEQATAGGMTVTLINQ